MIRAKAQCILNLLLLKVLTISSIQCKKGDFSGGGGQNFICEKILNFRFSLLVVL